MSGKELLAAINASLNGTSAILIVIAWFYIRTRRNVRAHAYLMSSAVVVSAIFLCFYVSSYLLYGDRSSGLEPGPLRTGYFLLLASHVVLAMAILPMIALTLWLAWRQNWPMHRRVARPTFWMWLYVSVTGVIVYWMLYHLFPSIVVT